MATRSIYTSVHFNSKRSAERLANALETAERTKRKNVTMSKECKDVTRGQIKDFFKDVK